MIYRIITVHGTFAADTSFRGDRWWQLGSNFHSKIMSHLDCDGNDIQWMPFQWDGKNSERSRTLAAKDLRRRIKELQKNSRGKILIIAHSHGGGIAHEAIFGEDIRSRKIEGVDLITVGTPFFRKTADNFVTILSTRWPYTRLWRSYYLHPFLWA